MNRNVRRLFRNDGLIVLIVLVVCIVVICSSLFDKGGKNHNTELEIATKNCDLEAVKSLMKSDVNIGEKALRYSAGEGCLKIVKFLIINGININATNSFGWTPLHCAALGGHSEIIKFLLENGADPNIRNKKGETPRNMAEDMTWRNEHKLPYRKIVEMLHSMEKQRKSKQ